MLEEELLVWSDFWVQRVWINERRSIWVYEGIFCVLMESTEIDDEDHLV
jgi:hypothetical protein